LDHVSEQVDRRESLNSRRRQVGVVLERADEVGMLFASEEIAQQRRPVPLGTVSTPKPRSMTSMTSTGPPASSCQRCRAPAGSDI
jgi:hypothetical protein